MLRSMLRIAILLITVAIVRGKICPPACNPPRNITGCVGYRRASKCTQELVSVAASPVVCGCMWQEFILSVEPEASIILTDDGEECYAWATVTCSSEKKDMESKYTVDEIQTSIVEGIAKLEKSIKDKTIINTAIQDVKNRKRNGVASEIDTNEGEIQAAADAPGLLSATPAALPQGFDFIGNTKKDGGITWLEVKPVQQTGKAKILSIGVQPSGQYWFPWHMQDDKFKLCVFMGILTLNLVVVLLAIFCGSDQKSQPKEDRPMGDLDPKMYLQNKQNKKNPFVRGFLRKIKKYKEKRAARSPKYSQLEGGRRGTAPSKEDLYYAERRQRQMSGIYEDLTTDDSQELDNIYDYEEPVYTRQRPLPPKYDGYTSTPSGMQSDRLSPTKQVSFTLPSSLPSSSQKDMQTGQRRKSTSQPRGANILSVGQYLDK